MVLRMLPLGVPTAGVDAPSLGAFLHSVPAQLQPPFNNAAAFDMLMFALLAEQSVRYVLVHRLRSHPPPPPLLPSVCHVPCPSATPPLTATVCRAVPPVHRC